MVDAVASLPDLLRLVAVPAFGWAAWQDHRTRRVPAWLWRPVIGLGVVVLGWEAVVVLGRPPPAGQLFLVRTVVSVGILVPLALAFSRFNLIGGADAKAFVALAVLFPTYPSYEFAGTVWPVVRPPLGVFSLTAITNGAILGMAYPLVMAAGNVLVGTWSPAMVRARRVHWTALPTVHGRLAERRDGRTLQGLDLDALRMYLRWRRSSLVDLRERPGELRDPGTIPPEPGEPTDGRVDPAEGLDRATRVDAPSGGRSPDDLADESASTDPWAAEAFLTSVGSAYGTSPDQLREGLELLSRADRVWVSPGLPYLVPVIAGLLLGLVYGDVLFAAMQVVGLG